MKNLLFFILVFTNSALIVVAQNVTIIEDFPIDKMMESFVIKNKSTYRLNGWRIQIMATTDRRKMEGAKRIFLMNYPNVSINWTHSKPYYRLRAGAFTSKLDAVRLLHLLKNDYPSAYLAKDNSIKPWELLDFQ